MKLRTANTPERNPPRVRQLHLPTQRRRDAPPTTQPQQKIPASSGPRRPHARGGLPTPYHHPRHPVKPPTYLQRKSPPTRGRRPPERGDAPVLTFLHNRERPRRRLFANAISDDEVEDGQHAGEEPAPGSPASLTYPEKAGCTTDHPTTTKNPRQPEAAGPRSEGTHRFSHSYTTESDPAGDYSPTPSAVMQFEDGQRAGKEPAGSSLTSLTDSERARRATNHPTTT